MEFRDNAEEASFRGEVRRFIEANMPKGGLSPEFAERTQFGEGNGSPEEEAFLERWKEALRERGWVAPHWPKEYGGAGMSVSEQFVFNEEMAEARAPAVGGMGVQMIGPILIMYGSEEQKKQHLPGITSGKVWWCQGYSEPGSGSDLASLQTRAVRDGDDYVINGQKIWTSGAHRADWMFMLARTDPDAPKHRGISMFLLDMKSPGISVRPLVNMANDHGFNEVFFDSVRVPARNMVGEENRAWYIGATLLDFERSNIRAAIQLRHTIDDLVRYVKDGEAKTGQVNVTPSIRAELADRLVEAEVARLICYRIISMQKRGAVPNYEASVNKLFYSEASQRAAQTGMHIIGLYGALHRDPKWAPLRGRLAHAYMTSVSGTIAAGTSEIQRNVIATRGLGLPRS
ncbi:MAG TPA: acyl-CoA dehydrogenase family protein [Dehalococcoidia bacterium]|nr:acyl-CoA dehydrogenase family protein [Dehalococcoidia bacterium]